MSSPPPPTAAAVVRPQSLSVCMIVKNEEKALPRCLESVKDIADEIIVADTGSTDRTAAIARSFGATVVSSPWRNDFSHARNASIDAARCCWILWLDADDVVPPASAQAIARLKQTPAASVLVFTVRNEKPGGTGSDFKQARMFPNRPDVRFERRIHEQISLSALRAGLPLVEHHDVLIEHHGYADPASVQAKARRNIEMLLAELDSARPDAVMAIELADAYALVGDSASAGRWYRAALGAADIEAVLPDAASHAHLGLGKVHNDAGEYAAARGHLEASLRICPNRPDTLYSLAVALEKLGDEHGAICRLLDILAIKEPQPLFVSIDFREARLKAYLRLERLLCKACRFNEARTLAAEAGRCLPARPEIHSMLGRAHARANELLDALHAFEKSLQAAAAGNIDAFVGLCFVYIKANRAATAQETMERIRPQFESYPRYWAARRMLLGKSEELPQSLDRRTAAEEETYLRAVFAAPASPPDSAS